MKDVLAFPNREAFRLWLRENGTGGHGVWLLFGKKGGPVTLGAGEALEEALCFGWIDGQMLSIDDKSYKKYFAPRRANSKWSAKNKALAGQLIKQGKMTSRGRQKIEEAKQNGQWNAPQKPAITEEQITLLENLLKGHEPAYINFAAMPPSVKKTYARAYLDAKTDLGREKRLVWILERLHKNLRPM